MTCLLSAITLRQYTSRLILFFDNVIVTQYVVIYLLLSSYRSLSLPILYLKQEITADIMVG